MKKWRVLPGPLALMAFVAYFGFVSTTAQAPAAPAQTPLPPALLDCPDLATAIRAVHAT